MSKVKICGLMTQEAVQTAVLEKADYIGFVFANSKREVTIEQAHKLSKDIPATIKKVGVFVNAPLSLILEAIRQVPLDMVQLHGQEDMAFIQKIPVNVIKAIPVNETIEESMQQFPGIPLLFDAPTAGSGKTFEWKKIMPQKSAQEFFIAGGLTPENVQEAIQFFQPFAVDVSSGVETNDRKDIEKIKKFIRRVKE